MSLPGFHFVPSRNLNTPISPMAGIPFANRNTQIKTTAKIDTQAVRKKRICMRSSFMLLHFTVCTHLSNFQNY